MSLLFFTKVRGGGREGGRPCRKREGGGEIWRRRPLSLPLQAAFFFLLSLLLPLCLWPPSPHSPFSSFTLPLSHALPSAAAFPTHSTASPPPLLLRTNLAVVLTAAGCPPSLPPPVGGEGSLSQLWRTGEAAAASSSFPPPALLGWRGRRRRRRRGCLRPPSLRSPPSWSITCLGREMPRRRMLRGPRPPPPVVRSLAYAAAAACVAAAADAGGAETQCLFFCA